MPDVLSKRLANNWPVLMSNAGSGVVVPGTGISLQKLESFYCAGSDPRKDGQAVASQLRCPPPRRTAQRG